MPSPASLELVIVTGEAVAVAPLPAQGELTLGRDPGCDVVIDSRSVSRRHAVLHVGDRLRLEDLGSANGTFVRDTRASVDTLGTQPLRRLSRETIELAIGERVNLGSVSAVVRRAAPPAPAATAAGSIIRDPAMVALYAQVDRAARSPISVLILGETGVGKEVLARAVHERSPRARGPFLELNCAALPPTLLEAELFGHEKGAFTGAAQTRPGLLESADGGTVFLDEIGELPAAVQVKLLRVLEDRKVLRIGGRSARPLDVRFVSATHRDLEGEIARGNFRQDLYFRLNGVAFTLPPLRERPSEVAPLAERFLATAAAALDHVAPTRLSAEALACLERYAWPGNVRELRNVIERAAVLAEGDAIGPADLPPHITGVARARATTPPPDPTPTAPRAATPTSPPPPGASDDERARILDALAQCAGNQTRAARLLGISLRTLVNRLDALDIPRPRK